MRILIGLLLVFPGVLLLPSLASHLYMAHGEQGSALHYAIVLLMLVGSPWAGMKILNT